MNSRKVGEVDAETVALLGLDIAPNTPIYLGESNCRHMEASHPEAFKRYFSHLEEILANPDYVNRNPRDGSIKYIKRISEYVVVGVRVSTHGKVFARTIFTFEEWKFRQYEQSGYLKAYTKKALPEGSALTKSSRQGD